MHSSDTDEDLLTAEDPEAFGRFYVRHHANVQAYFARRVGRDQAADLAAETFASALIARRRFRPGPTPATGWLYAIAARRLADHYRRGATETRLREALTAARVSADLPAAGVIEPADELAGLLRHLPAEQREALIGRFALDREYGEIAQQARASEASVRQRVSRGLGALRGPLALYRAAQELARQDRAYRFGGGHQRPLRTLAPGQALDCSSAASLLLQRVGLFASEEAWGSGRFASEWGEPGEGRYVTVWADDEHVWLEFRLDGDHAERFDPTPSRLAPRCGWLGRRDLAPATARSTPRHWPGL